MSRTVDDRVVNMSFENDKFKAAVTETITALGRLKNALNFTGAGKGLQEIDSAASKVNLDHISNSAETASSHFSLLHSAAAVAMGGIAAHAAIAGAQVVKSFTLGPIMDGFKNYETQIGAVQTIMANTGLKGSSGMAQVNAVLKQLNTYANQTVYNFSDMAKNIGTFTAAGVGLKDSEESIKGIANLAALSGSNSEQASTAMYQLSQAIAAGRVKLQDWNSVVNAGLGGKVFQSALFNTAEAMGTIKNAKLGETFDQWTSAGNSFRNSLQSGWVTSKVLTTTLAGFTGDLTTAQLKSKGYTADQIAHIQDIGKTAIDAATKIKTMSQLTQALKEEVATAWAAIFKTIFGNITDATSLFSAAHTVLENALTKPIYDLNTLLEGWSKLGGRTDLINALKNVWKSFGDVVGAVKDAFRDVFPATTAQNLVSITQTFDDFTKHLIPSKQTVEELRQTFAGLFAILDIGKTLLGDVIHIFTNVTGAVLPAGGGFLALTAHIGDFLVKIDEAVKKGDIITGFFGGLAHALSSPVALFSAIADAVHGLFSAFGGGSTSGASSAISSLTDKLPPLSKVTQALTNGWNDFVNILQKAVPIFKPIISGLQNLFNSIVTFLSNSLQNMNFDNLLHAIDTGLLGGIFLLFKRFFSGGSLLQVVQGGIFGNLNETFEALTGNLKAMQQNIKSNAILQIGIAVGILAASMVALSTIPAQKMQSSMSAMAIGMGELVGALAILNKIGEGFLGAVKLDALAAGLILLSTAVGILVISLKELSKLDWNQLQKGLVGVGVLLAEIVAAVEPLTRESAGMISAGLGIIAIATGIRILAGAVGDFGNMNWEQIAKGLGAVAIALVTIGGTARLFPPGMVTIGAGLIGVAAGIRILADAIGKLGDMNMSHMVQGLIGLGGALGAVALGMHAMPPGLATQAAGLVLVSVAIKSVAESIKVLGAMGMQQAGAGLLTLAGALVVLGGALNLFDSALPGAAALVVASGALALLAPSMEILGRMDVGNLVMALVALGGAMTVLGVAGALIAPVAPALLALGVALLAIGGGLALAGAGIFLVSTGLSALAVAGPIAIGVVINSIINFVEAIPKIVESIVLTLETIVTSLAKAAPQFVVGIGKILSALADAVIQAAPAIARAFDALVQNALKVIRDNFPNLVDTGLGMIVSLLAGLQSHIGEVTTHAIGIVTTFLDALAKHMPEIVTSGARLLEKFLTGIANNIGQVVSHGVLVVTKFVLGIADNLWRITSAAATLIAKFIGALASGIIKTATEGANAIIHFITGISSKIPAIVSTATTVVVRLIDALANSSVRLINAGANAIIHFMNGLADAIRSHSKQLADAGWNIATGIIDGLVSGIGELGHKAIDAIGNLVTSLPKKALGLLGIHSPSTVFIEIGNNIVEGLYLGIDNNKDKPVTAVEDMTNSMVNVIQQIPGSMADILDFGSPVITPVLDLSKVQADAPKIAGFIDPQAVIDMSKIGGAVGTPDTSSLDPSLTDSTATDTSGAGGIASPVVFNQYNTSPDALSEVDIYRQTSNQLAQLGPVLPGGG